MSEKLTGQQIIEGIRDIRNRIIQIEKNRVNFLSVYTVSPDHPHYDIEQFKMNLRKDDEELYQLTEEIRTILLLLGVRINR